MKLGWVLLGVWLVLSGLTVLVQINIPSRQAVMGILALLSGIFILLNR
jgi:hypothetical protein